MNPFASTIMHQKYIWVEKGEKEWSDIAKRVVKNVMKSVGVKFTDPLAKELVQVISNREFIPGGRYLYAAGREYHQTQNCLLLEAEDSREGWAELMQKSTLALMTGAGIGIDYSDIRGEGKRIRKTGGYATGPIAAMGMINEAGRGIMQGGSRRSAIWAGLNWKHSDIHRFIKSKNWSEDVKKLKEKDYNFPAFLDGTNISVQLDDEFLLAYHNEKHQHHSQAQSVYWATVEQMLRTAEPGFSIDLGKNSKETLRNACVTGDTEILTRDGYKQIKDLVDKNIEIWNGFEWSETIPKITGTNQSLLKITFSDGRQLTCTPYHKFHIAKGYSGQSEVIEAQNLNEGMKLIKHIFPIIEHGEEYKYAYDQGFISAEGMDGYDFAFVYEPKYMCLNRLNGKSLKEYKGRKAFRFDHETLPKAFVPFNWNLKSKLDWLAGLFDGDATELIEGGLQLASIDYAFLINVQKLLSTLGIQCKVTLANIAGNRLMPDGRGDQKEYFCKTLWRVCVGAVQMQELKRLGLKCERLKFDKTPQRDASQFVRIVDIVECGIAETVYCFNEPKRHLGIFNGILTGQCTEVTSADDSDICNLGSINMARITSLEHMAKVVELAVAFLIAGTVYSDVPYPKVDQVRTKNRRLGLGLMGLHDWLLSHGKKYGPDSDLQKYMEIYETSTDIAKSYANKWDLSSPVKTRAIAPTGTIGILAETTSGLEPIFCSAFKRRYLKHTTWQYQYVVDPTAKRLVEETGINPDFIEDAYSIAENVERRVEFQAWMQGFVDHAISSTINLPAWGSELNNENRVRDFGNMLIKYIPNLRGITAYPDGCRGGQPLTPVKFSTAMKNIGEVFVEQQDICDIKGGSCGS